MLSFVADVWENTSQIIKKMNCINVYFLLFLFSFEHLESWSENYSCLERTEACWFHVSYVFMDSQNLKTAMLEAELHELCQQWQTRTVAPFAYLVSLLLIDYMSSSKGQTLVMTCWNIKPHYCWMNTAIQERKLFTTLTNWQKLIDDSQTFSKHFNINYSMYSK